MNLENLYGSQDSLMKVFSRALTYNDHKTIYLQLVDIYDHSNSTDLEQELFRKMTKKFKDSTSVWKRYGFFVLTRLKDPDAATALLKKALLSLPKRKHIATIAAFGQMLFKNGFVEHGRTIYEGILTNYPKRFDLWSTYIDLHLSTKADPNITRRVFESVVSLKMSSKKMKFFLKRFLAFEKQFGDSERINHVKNLAEDYLSSKRMKEVKKKINK